MIDKEMKEKMKQRYASMHPLLFQRSCEYANSAGDLFDILDTMPECPVIWDKNKRRWVNLPDPIMINFEEYN